MEAAVGAGFSSISGVIPPKGDLNDDGDMRLTELARRGGATPLADWSEFRDAFLRRVGVAERESRPLEEEGPFKGLLGAPRLLATLGERLMAALEGEGLGEERGDFAGDDRESESCFRECDKSASSLFLTLRLLVDPLRRGEE